MPSRKYSSCSSLKTCWKWKNINVKSNVLFNRKRKENVCKKNIIFVLGESQGILKSFFKEMDYLICGAVSAYFNFIFKKIIKHLKLFKLRWNYKVARIFNKRINSKYLNKMLPDWIVAAVFRWRSWCRTARSCWSEISDFVLFC